MSVLIKGWTKPDDCEGCPFCDMEDVDFDYEYYCTLTKKYFDYNQYYFEIYKNECPIEEVYNEQY